MTENDGGKGVEWRVRPGRDQTVQTFVRGDGKWEINWKFLCNACLYSEMRFLKEVLYQFK
jgi:hypothetical protein